MESKNEDQIKDPIQKAKMNLFNYITLTYSEREWVEYMDILNRYLRGDTELSTLQTHVDELLQDEGLNWQKKFHFTNPVFYLQSY